MKILNFGSLNIDYVYKVDHHARSGETVIARSMERFCGGKGLNQSVSLRKAGADVFHAGCIGSDGDMLIRFLESCGVDTHLIDVVPGASGHAIIQVDEGGANCIVLHGGANQGVTSEHIDRVLCEFGKGDFVLLQNEVNRLDEIMSRAYDKGMVIALNPSPINDMIFRLPLEKVTYFILNEIEGKEISGKHDEEEILNELLARYPNSRIVLTLGSEGSIYGEGHGSSHEGSVYGEGHGSSHEGFVYGEGHGSSHEGSIHGKRQGSPYIRQDAYKVEAVDTTAAGDTFTGYFLFSIMDGKTPEQALDMASKASAIAVSRLGAAPSIPTRQEVEDYHETFGD